MELANYLLNDIPTLVIGIFRVICGISGIISWLIIVSYILNKL